jgi:hypothetical protein
MIFNIEDLLENSAYDFIFSQEIEKPQEESQEESKQLSFFFMK